MKLKDSDKLTAAVLAAAAISKGVTPYEAVSSYLQVVEQLAQGPRGMPEQVPPDIEAIWKRISS